MFNIIGAVEFERALIRERVKAGLRNARAKEKRLGRPARDVDAAIVARLRSQGASWRAISLQLGVGVAMLHRAATGRSKTREKISLCRWATFIRTNGTVQRWWFRSWRGDWVYMSWNELN
jgi:DNA invertase Pin-like site-specific DNA recombinase